MFTRPGLRSDCSDCILHRSARPWLWCGGSSTPEQPSTVLCSPEDVAQMQGHVMLKQLLKHGDGWIPTWHCLKMRYNNGNGTGLMAIWIGKTMTDQQSFGVLYFRFGIIISNSHGPSVFSYCHNVLGPGMAGHQTSSIGKRGLCQQHAGLDVCRCFQPGTGLQVLN